MFDFFALFSTVKTPPGTKCDLTGRVVGVIQRNWRDYVACFDEEEINVNVNSFS